MSFNQKKKGAIKVFSCSSCIQRNLNNFTEEKGAGLIYLCFGCPCSAYLPHGIVDSSAVCDCVISWSYELT